MEAKGEEREGRKDELSAVVTFLLNRLSDLSFARSYLEDDINRLVDFFWLISAPFAAD